MEILAIVIVLAAAAKAAIEGECTIASAVGWLTLIIVLAVASVWGIL